MLRGSGSQARLQGPPGGCSLSPKRMAVGGGMGPGLWARWGSRILNSPRQAGAPFRITARKVSRLRSSHRKEAGQNRPPGPTPGLSSSLQARCWPGGRGAPPSSPCAELCSGVAGAAPPACAPRWGCAVGLVQAGRGIATDRLCGGSDPAPPASTSSSYSRRVSSPRKRGSMVER